MYKRLAHRLLRVAPAVVVAAFFAGAAFAAELDSLGFGDEDAVDSVSVARIPRPISQVAENVTVVTADDILRLNAHTLADVLQTVPGIQLDYQRTPGTFSFFNIQGAISSTVLVLIDGVRQSDFFSNLESPGLIPVQMIDRIEITKGPGSSVYGSASGGVINIITKSPDPERKAAGMASGSVGSSFTADSRAELSGTVDRFGYYLNAGNLRSDGFHPNTQVNQNNLYGKFTYLLPGEGKMTFGLWHLVNHAGMDAADARQFQFFFDDTRDNSRDQRSYGFLSLTQPLTPQLTFDFDAYATARDEYSYFNSFDQGVSTYAAALQTSTHYRGTNTRLNWQDGDNTLVIGTEYGHVWASNQELLTNTLFNSRTWDSWAGYANASVNLGQLTVIPGIRYDSTGINGDFTSYTLGATYQLAGNTTLRAYAGKGFTLPRMTLAQKERIKTVQAGVETGAVPFLWLKGTYFFNAVRDTAQGPPDQDRQGVELEARTVPVAGVSLSTGYTYQHVKDADSGQVVHTDSNQSVPSHLLKLALRYDNKDLGLRGTMTGNWLYWNAGPYTYFDAAGNPSVRSYPVSDKGMNWDLHLNWRTRPRNDLSPELFFSVRNVFNGSQTAMRIMYPSQPRWFEGGARVRF